MAYQAAFIAGGELLLIDDQDQVTSIASRFIADAEKREAKTQNLNAWKSDTQAWGQTWMAPEWSRLAPASGAELKRMTFTNVSSDRGNVAYSIGMPGGGGLFRFDLPSKIEQRLMHRNAFFPQGLSARKNDGLLVFSVPEPSGTSSIVLGQRDGVQHVRLTSGDSRDEAPVWAHLNDVDTIYFHSFGIGRNQLGHPIGYGPATICRIQIGGEDVETVAQAEQFDYLQPKLSAEGELYCIRRPYVASNVRPLSFVDLLKDVLYFPFRFARAIYYFANFISVMFSGKPLAESHRDPSQQPVTREMVLWGRALNTKRSLQSKRNGEATLAPSDWEIVRILPSGMPEVLVSGALCFDLSSTGQIIYSDGSGVYRRDPNGESRLSSQKGVSQIAALN